VKNTLELSDGGFDVGLEASEVLLYFQTTIRIGKSDMHELTNSAVEMAFGVGFLGGSGVGTALPLRLGLGLS